MTLLAGQRFADRFTVVRLVGEGGMGVVYEVADGRFAGQRRALKTLRPGKESDARSRELFAREATATATIESDHVVKVHDYDLDAAVPWVLMELFSGESLDERVAKSGPLEWDDARRRVSELGHALGAAHRAGVLHLDLKPANLFLARQNDVEGSTRLKVLDFGLSRVVLEGKTHVLQSRAMGTEAWMPPEQFNKKSELRPSADVWPLGLIAFWMLTARHYWPSVDAQGEVDDAMTLMREVSDGVTASASERAGAGRRAGVAAGLRRVVRAVPREEPERAVARRRRGEPRARRGAGAGVGVDAAAKHYSAEGLEERTQRAARSDDRGRSSSAA